MTLRLSFLLTVLCLLAANPSSAGASPKRFLDIQTVTSPGGITAWLVEDHTAPVISMQFAFAGAGAVTDPAGKEGLTQLASNTMDEGAGDIGSPAFQKELADKSIDLHYSTSRDDYYGAVKTLRRQEDRAFELLRLSLTAPRFDAEPVQRMKEANIARIRDSLSDPDWMGARIMNDAAFAGHPYARNTGGTIGSIGRITAEDLRTYVKNNLTRDRLRIAVCGDIDKAALAAALDKIFGSLPARAQPFSVPDVSLQNKGVSILYKREMPQTIIMTAEPGISRKDPDWQAAQIMNFILGGGFGSRLTAEIREKRGLVYGINSGFEHLDHISTLMIETSTRNEKAGEVMDLMHKELVRMRDTDITPQELRDSKSYLVGSMPLALNSTGNISAMLLSLELDDLPQDYLDTAADKINAVTAADIRRVAARVLTPDQMVTVMVGQPQNIKPTKTLEKLPDAE